MENWVLHEIRVGVLKAGKFFWKEKKTLASASVCCEVVYVLARGVVSSAEAVRR